MKTLQYAFRFLARSKSYTFINLFGLAFSLACCIILVRYIHRELAVDTHCMDRDHTFMAIRDIDNNRHIGNLADVNDLVGKEIVTSEDIVKRCSFHTFEQNELKYNKQSYSIDMLMADSTFFHFFQYPVVAGEARLSAPDDAILTRSLATIMFGDEDPIGKVLNFEDKTITVRGVIDNPIGKTSFKFDIILSYYLKKDWGRLVSEFIHFAPHVDVEKLNAESNVSRMVDYGRKLNMRYEFVSLYEAYKRTNPFKDAMFQHTNMTYIYLLSCVALLLLLVGLLNFVNIYMVLMMTRNKEFGIKKVFGLQNFPLFVQIWLENMLLMIPALFFAWLMVEITQVPVNRLFQEEIRYTWFDLWLSLGFIVLIPLFTTIYPYIRYNYRTAITSMRGIATNHQSVRMRMAFLFVQYVLTISIIVVSLYFSNHLNFLLNTPPGFRTEGVLNANLLHQTNPGLYTTEKLQSMGARNAILRQRLDECPYFEKYLCGINLFDGYDSNVYNDKDQMVKCKTLFTNGNIFSLYDIPVIEGAIPDIDKLVGQKLVLNRAAMRAFGYTNYEEAFIRWESAQWVSVRHDGTREEGGVELTPIVAVVEDFYTGHMTEGIKPMVFIISSIERLGTANIFIKPGQEQAMLEYLKGVSMEINNTEEFGYSWLKDEVLSFYENDRKVTTIYNIFAVIAIIISCLGLFGISLFDIRQRYREIGIRKVNGAGMKDLYRLLFRKYFIVLGISFVVATPIAYYLIYQYTADFVVKAPIGIAIFVVALLLVALISFGTLYWQIRKAANINPADVVKSE